MELINYIIIVMNSKRYTISEINFDNLGFYNDLTAVYDLKKPNEFFY